jgi:CBS domain containing-hemolysin-like protein
MVRPQRAAQNLSGPLRIFSIAFAPIIWVSNHLANFVVRRFGVEPREDLASARSVEELELLVRSSAERGAIDPEAVTLVERSVRFGDKTAADALVPRLAIRALQRDDTVNALVAAAVETGFSRFPVYGVDLDDIGGVVHVKDVYALPPSQRHATPVGQIATQVLAVPETRPLDDLLADLRARHEHLAAVVDEHGGTAGIVTLEDLLEEIVGEIADEYDPPPTSITRPGPGDSVTLPGSLHPDEVRDASGFEIPDGPYDTLAGFVLERLGHIPEPGETARYGGWNLTVTELDRRRIAAVRMQPPEDDSNGANEGQQFAGRRAGKEGRSIADEWVR